MPNFKTDLARGKVGEALLVKIWPCELIALNGKGADFLEPSTGRHLELKADHYKNPKNFFIERISNDAKQTPGGPWQALEHGCELFVYMFLAEKCYYVFDTQELVTVLETYIPGWPEVVVPNQHYNTIGWKVPIYAIESIGTKVSFE